MRANGDIIRLIKKRAENIKKKTHFRLVRYVQQSLNCNGKNCIIF